MFVTEKHLLEQVKFVHIKFLLFLPFFLCPFSVKAKVLPALMDDEVGLLTGNERTSYVTFSVLAFFVRCYFKGCVSMR